MAGTNKFLVFDQNKNNIQDDSTYLADTQRLNGFASGVARSILVNKALYQASLLNSAWGSLLSDNNLDALEDISGLKTNLDALMTLIANNTTMSILNSGAVDFSSYMVFCNSSANSDVLDAAFGKNNESYLKKIGQQLAMYAWFKGDSKTTYPFTNLLTCDTFASILSSSTVLQEMLMNYNIPVIIKSSLYAYALYIADAVKLLVKTIIINLAGVTNTYATLELLLTSSTEVSKIASSTAVTIVGNYYPAITAVATTASIVTAYGTKIGKILTYAGNAAFWANSNAIAGWLALYQSGSSNYVSATNGFCINTVGYSNTYWFYINIDLTGLKTLCFTHQSADLLEGKVTVGGTSVFDQTYINGTFAASIDVSSYTGVKTIGFGNSGGAGSSSNHAWTISNLYFKY